ncbi:MAG: hypothetical protein RL685_1700 [Pseudomonadota bacterium]|jgi:hypothetical protein
MANKLFVGIAVGIGLKWLSPHFLPVVGELISPLTRLDVKLLAKAGLKASWLGLERGRELLAYMGETVQDVVAEAREELVRAEPAVTDQAS